MTGIANPNKKEIKIAADKNLCSNWRCSARKTKIKKFIKGGIKR